MNKTDLVNLIAEKSSFTKKDSSMALETFIESVEETLEKGEKVQLVGFGTFETRERAAKIGRNPRTKEKISIPAATVPVFKAGKEFKEKVNKLCKVKGAPVKKQVNVEEIAIKEEKPQKKQQNLKQKIQRLKRNLKR